MSSETSVALWIAGVCAVAVVAAVALSLVIRSVEHGSAYLMVFGGVTLLGMFGLEGAAGRVVSVVSFAAILGLAAGIGTFRFAGHLGAERRAAIAGLSVTAFLGAIAALAYTGLI